MRWKLLKKKNRSRCFLFLFCFVFVFLLFSLFLIFRGPSLGEYLKNSRNMKRVIDPGELSTFIS